MRCPECGRSYWPDDFERDETYFECNECAVELDSPLQRPSTEPKLDGPELAPMALESDPMNGSQHPASTAPNDVLASPGEAATTADAGGSLADHNGLVLVVIYLALSACTLFDPSLRAINGIPQGAILLPVAIHVITIWGLVDRRLWGLYLAYVFLILRLLGGALVDVNYLSTLDVGPLLYTAVRGLAIPAPLLALIWLSINRRLFDDVSR
jgi:hypothetical protein